MAFSEGYRAEEAEGYHVQIGDKKYLLDESGENGEPFRRWTQLPSQISINNVTAGAGEGDFSDDLVWAIDKFDGEGQKVLDSGSPDLVKRFHKSEGLDFRTPGEFKLNKSSVLTRPPTAALPAATVYQGEADFEDNVGTSSGGTGTYDTDRSLNATGDSVRLATGITPGTDAGGNVDVRADFFAYCQDPAASSVATTVQGSAFTTMYPGDSGVVSGTDFKSTQNFQAGPDGIGIGQTNLWAKKTITGLTAGQQYFLRLYGYSNGGFPTISLLNIFADNVNTGPVILSTAYQGAIPGLYPTSTQLVFNVSFTAPASGTVVVTHRAYQNIKLSGNYYTYLDKIEYGLSLVPNANSVTISVYNTTDTAVTVSQTINLNTVSQGIHIGTLSYQAVNGKTYEYRIQRNTPDASLGTTQSNLVWLDKVNHYVLTAAGVTVSVDTIHLGQGGTIWGSGTVGTDFVTWTYDFPTREWTKRRTVSATNVRAVETTDLYEYFLVGTAVSRQTTSADSSIITGLGSGAVGMAIAQDRIFILREDATNGIDVDVFGLAGGSALSTSGVQTAGITTDTSLRQRMCGTPTGARFFVNHAGISATIWETDASGEVAATTQIATLPQGIKATAIAYSDGLTFICGQETAESGSTGFSGMWVIDQDADISFAGWMRPSSPLASPPIAIQAWGNDVYVLEGGKRIWRYNLLRGGFFLEYELTPSTATTAKGLAVMKDHMFAAFSGTDGGVWVTGSALDLAGTSAAYRPSGGSASNQFVSSQYHMGIPFGNKILNSIDLLTAKMDNNCQAKVEYQVDESGTWITAGTALPGASAYHFPGPTGNDTVNFRFLQVRVTLTSETGTYTPIVKAIVIRARPSPAGINGSGGGSKDYIDMVVRCDDYDASDHPSGDATTGYDRRKALYNIYNSGQRVTLIDGYDSKRQGENTSYLVQIVALDDRRTQLGESSCMVRCQIL